MQTLKPLDIALLGRPLQAFDAMAYRIAQHLGEQLQQAGHRSVTLHVDQARFVPLRPCNISRGEQDVQLPRAVVQALMAARYGFIDEDPSEAQPASATELRITANLHAALQAAVVDVLMPHHAGAPATSAMWQWQAQITLGQAAAQTLQVRLDSACCAALEHYIQQQRRSRTTTETSTCALEVDVQALLVKKIMTAADIQDLRVGSVLPISLERACVHINGQSMLSASVAEHQGKLHLTAFETLE